MNKVSVEIDSKVNELFAKTNVIQKFKNQSKDPLELKIYIYKNANLIFSSFNAKIGDSIKVQSKVIKKEKAEIKYTDSISSGNAAIFVAEDPSEPDRIIINMGNIPQMKKYYLNLNLSNLSNIKDHVNLKYLEIYQFLQESMMMIITKIKI